MYIFLQAIFSSFQFDIKLECHLSYETFLEKSLICSVYILSVEKKLVKEQIESEQGINEEWNKNSQQDEIMILYPLNKVKDL